MDFRQKLRELARSESQRTPRATDVERGGLESPLLGSVTRRREEGGASGADAAAEDAAAAAVVTALGGEIEPGPTRDAGGISPPPGGPSEHDSARAKRHWAYARDHVGALMHEGSQFSDDGLFNTGRMVKRLRTRAVDKGSAADSFMRFMTDAPVLGTGGVLGAVRNTRGRSSDGSASERPGVFAPGTDMRATIGLLTSSYLNVLALCAPAGIVAGLMGAPSTWVFSLNFLALLPLALMLGEVTEDLAVRFGDTIGGLLNATFGNVVELILSIAALKKGLYTVVATSLIGSILSNLLLVLGMCFLFGGIKYRQQTFSQLANKIGSSLLFVAAIGIIIPTAARTIYGDKVVDDATLLSLSHAIALVLLGSYIAYLYFQLGTHADLFQTGGGSGDSGGERTGEPDGSPAAASDGDGDSEWPALSLVAAGTLLTAITIVVAICSEYLTGAIESVTETFGINQAFLGLIVLPIAGNACEHLTAVFVAMKDKMDLSIGVAIGSSAQIALFVIPVSVLAGWAMGQPFTLDFDLFAVLMLTLSVILAYFVSSDGSSNWLLGLLLCVVYVIIAAVFFFEHEPTAPGKP